MEYKRVHWLLDEVYAQTHPKDWDEAHYLSKRLIQLIGTPKLEHLIVNPLESYKKVTKKLLDAPGIDPTAIIDLSKWLSPGISTIFPQAHVVRNFSLSRVQNAATPDFQTAGYVLRHSVTDTAQEAERLNLDRPLVIDDTAVSGGTVETSMKLFGIEPGKSANVFLLANTGFFPHPEPQIQKPGALQSLENAGNRVLYGDSLSTPEDDAEHVSDVFRDPHVFSVALKLREATATSADYAQGFYTFYKNHNGTELFPHQISAADIRLMEQNGRFVKSPTYNPNQRAVFSRNPSLWTFNAFWEKVDEAALISNKALVQAVMNRLHALSTDDEGRYEINERLKAETRAIIGSQNNQR